MTCSADTSLHVHDSSWPADKPLDVDGLTWYDALRGDVGEGNGSASWIHQGAKALQHGHIGVRRCTQCCQIPLQQLKAIAQVDRDMQRELRLTFISECPGDQQGLTRQSTTHKSALNCFKAFDSRGPGKKQERCIKERQNVAS